MLEIADSFGGIVEPYKERLAFRKTVLLELVALDVVENIENQTLVYFCSPLSGICG